MKEAPAIDKSKWGPGEWQREPDRVEFEHAGLSCLLNRVGSSGHWCGYVAVPPGHPMFEMGYDEPPVRVHGGLTYAEHCSGSICHVPKPGEPDNVWWFGFDCAHLGDVTPGHPTRWDHDAWYKDVQYVTEETRQLAEQLSSMHGTGLPEGK